MADLHLNPGAQKMPSSSFSKNSARKADKANVSMARIEKEKRLKKACADFEAIFVEQLFKTMRASVPNSGLLEGGRAEEIYTSMLDQQIAQEMALGQSSFGLAHQMNSNLDAKVFYENTAEMKER
jgi:flagellar protein FlgJ